MSRFDNIFEYDNNLNGAGLKVGIVMAASTCRSAKACFRPAWPN
jgi:hypothetical protein